MVNLAVAPLKFWHLCLWFKDSLYQLHVAQPAPPEKRLAKSQEALNVHLSNVHFDF